MSSAIVNALVWLVVLAAVIVLFAWPRRKRGRAGAAAPGSNYDQLNEDKRKAVEIVVGERAEARDPSKSHG